MKRKTLIAKLIVAPRIEKIFIRQIEMFRHIVKIEDGKAQITWKDKKLKGISVEFDEPMEIDPMLRPLDLRPIFMEYFKGLNLVHEKTDEFLKSADAIKNMTLDQVPKEIRSIMAQGPGRIQDIENFNAFRKKMVHDAKDQILAIKQKTKVPGKQVQLKKILRKCDCVCNALCYLLKKEDGTHWWKCDECGKEVRAKKEDITNRVVIFMMEEKIKGD